MRRFATLLALMLAMSSATGPALGRPKPPPPPPKAADYYTPPAPTLSPAERVTSDAMCAKIEASVNKGFTVPAHVLVWFAIPGQPRVAVETIAIGGMLYSRDKSSDPWKRVTPNDVWSSWKIDFHGSKRPKQRKRYWDDEICRSAGSGYIDRATVDMYVVRLSNKSRVADVHVWISRDGLPLRMDTIFSFGWRILTTYDYKNVKAPIDTPVPDAKKAPPAKPVAKGRK